MFKNSMKTAVLLASLGGLIVGVAALLGGGSSTAVMFGLIIALAMVGGSYWFSDKLALRAANAQVITEQDHPEFYRMVADLAQRAQLPMLLPQAVTRAQPLCVQPLAYCSHSRQTRCAA
jgi:heat shock protein HtpX